MPGKYTLILDVGGGTYMSQKDAVSAHAALKYWAESLEIAVLKAFEVNDNAPISKAVNDVVASPDGITPITGLKSAWFVSLEVNDIYGFLNIIKTA